MPTSSSLRALLQDGMLGRALRGALARGMRDRPELASPARGVPEVRLVGLDPIRVLIIGSGLAVGYGVATHGSALTGGLAEAVRGTGARGVIVQNRATPLRSLNQTIGGLGLVGAASFHLVVWCPSLLDVVRTPDRGAYRTKLLEGLQLLRDTSMPGADLVVCDLPQPTHPGRVEDLAGNRVPRFNAALRRAVAPHPDVRVATTPSITSLLDPDAFSAGYYRTWAERIVRPEPAAPTT